MKSTNENPYLKYTEILYRAFAHFNKVLANDELKSCIITIGTRGRKAAFGWFRPEGWKKGKDDKMHEINICAEYLSRSIDEVLETLIHELVHNFNKQKGIKDCSATNWHNKHFKATAEQFGLIVEKMEGKGWAKTSLGLKAKEAIKSFNLDSKEIPLIHRCEKRRGNKGGNGNSFIMCTKADKQRVVGLCGGMKQVDFVTELLDLYEERQDDKTELREQSKHLAT
jgi:hypothetical protein